MEEAQQQLENMNTAMAMDSEELGLVLNQGEFLTL